MGKGARQLTLTLHGTGVIYGVSGQSIGTVVSQEVVSAYRSMPSRKEEGEEPISQGTRDLFNINLGYEYPPTATVLPRDAHQPLWGCLLLPNPPYEDAPIILFLGESGGR